MNIFFHREYRVQTTLRVPLPHFMLHRVIGTIATPVSIQTEPAAGVAPKSLVLNQKSPLRSLRPLRFHFSILYPPSVKSVLNPCHPWNYPTLPVKAVVLSPFKCI